jgi:hypothetical protein
VQQAIRISYVENADHLMEATEEAQMPTQAIPKWVQNTFIGLVIAGALLAAFIEESRKGVEKGILLISALAVIGILCFWIVVFRALGLGKPSKRNRKSYEKWYRKLTGRDQTQVVCEFGEAGFLVTGEGGVSNHSPWPTVVRAVERPKGLLVYTAPQIFNWFPKTVFASEADYDSLLQLVATKVAKFERIPSTG